MPSRRSDRGGALRRQLERAEGQRPDLEKALEERRRFEADRDHTLRVGFEEWDNLDADTRQALVREGVVVAGASGLADLATSPRKLGLNQAVKGFLSRFAPGIAKGIFARSPRKEVVKLMDKIKKVRADRVKRREEREKAIREIQRDLDRRGPEILHDTARRKVRNRHMFKKRFGGARPFNGLEALKDPKFIMALGLKTGSDPRNAIIREMIQSEDEHGNREVVELAKRLLEAGEKRGINMSAAEEALVRHQQRKEQRRLERGELTEEEFQSLLRQDRPDLKRVQ
jgi:sulfite reductase beta subunit-like hemoprotein